MSTGPLNALTLYQTALHHPLLDRKTERRLLTLALSGDLPALDLLCIHNQRLVYREALRVENTGLAGELELLDLIQLGNLGLLKAIHKFDLTRDNKLSTYAVPWIRLEIERGARARGHPLDIGINKSLHLARVRRCAAALYQQTEHWPTPAELATHTGLSLALVLEALTFDRLTLHSLNTTPHEDDTLDALHDLTPDPDAPNPETEALTTLALQTMQTAVAALPLPLRTVLEMRYGLNGYPHPHNYRTIGKHLGFSRTWAQKLETDALTLLKNTLNNPPETH